MPLFDLNKAPVKMVKIKNIENEQEIHKLISNNLETILGVRFLCSEFKFTDGRIDTLGVDGLHIRKSTYLKIQRIFECISL